MQLILLERVRKLGQIGDVVSVKDGYARNFLLPQGKALRANKNNLAQFENQRAQIEAKNLEHRTEAEKVASKLDGNIYIAIRQSSDTGQLYGSVSSRDIVQILSENDFEVSRSQVELSQPIKALGIHTVKVTLHPEVEVAVEVNVARTQEEASMQAKGEDIFKDAEDTEQVEIEEFFSDEALAQQKAEQEDVTYEDEPASESTDLNDKAENESDETQSEKASDS